MKPQIIKPLSENLIPNKSILFDTNIWINYLFSDLSQDNLSTKSPEYQREKNIDDLVVEIQENHSCEILVIPTIISELVNQRERANFKIWKHSVDPKNTAHIPYKKGYRDSDKSPYVKDTQAIWKTITEEIIDDKENVKFIFPSESAYNKAITYCSESKNIKTDLNDSIIVYTAIENQAAVFSVDKDLQEYDLERPATIYTI